MLKKTGHYAEIKVIAVDVGEDLRQGMSAKDIMTKWGQKLDKFLRLLESLHFKAEDLAEEWPDFSGQLV